MYTDIFLKPFISTALNEALSAEAYLERMREIELALAQVQEDMGIWPAGTAKAMRDHLTAVPLLTPELLEGIGKGGNVAIPLVKLLRQALPAELKPCLHVGPTSQDLVDTALVLELQKAMTWMTSTLDHLEQALAALALTYRDTPMVGRTLQQQALPITFGLKVANWLVQVREARLRLQQLLPSLLQLQLGGAAGTLAALGDKGIETSERLAERLGLGMPVMPWHTNRQAIHGLFTGLDALMVALEKLATDISLLAQTEVGEVAEPAEEGMGESSSMPHKRNPVRCALILAACAKVHGSVAGQLHHGAHSHERSLGDWHSEWPSLYEVLLLVGGALEQSLALAQGLEVFPARMRENLYVTQGVIMAEAVTHALRQQLSADVADRAVKAATKQALKEGRPFVEVLHDNSDVARAVSLQALTAMAAPEAYLGSSQRFVDRVLAQS